MENQEPRLEDQILKSIQGYLRHWVKEEIEKLVEDFREKLKGEAGRIAVKLSSHFNVRTRGNEIIITFEVESKR